MSAASPNGDPRQPLLQDGAAFPGGSSPQRALSKRERREQAMSSSLARVERIDESLQRLQQGISSTRAFSPMRGMPSISPSRLVPGTPTGTPVYAAPPVYATPPVHLVSPTNGMQEHSSQATSFAAGTKDDAHRESTLFDQDIVQMSSPMYFVEESERKLTVEVMRLGAQTGRSKVRYHTEDGSAKAGERYRSASGEIVFKPGDHTKEIQLAIIADDKWAATLEFKLVLTDPEGCELGQYLHTCRIKIIDNDVFPSSKYDEEIEEGEEGIEKIDGNSLMMEYFKLNLSVEGVAWRTLLVLCLDQMSSLYELLTLFLSQYLIDVLFNTEPKEEEEVRSKLWFTTEESGLDMQGRYMTALAVAALYIAPMLCLHVWAFYKAKLDLGGMTREYLQTNLFRKYLNFSEASRTKVSPSHMQVAIIQDTGEVAESYMASLELMQCVGKLVALCYFILQENPSAIVPVVAMPSMMMCWVRWRSSIMVEVGEHAAAKTAHVVELVSEATAKYRLIADYQQRPQMCDLFSQRAEELSHADVPVDLVKTNNAFFPRWLGPFFTGLYLCLQTRMVLQGDISTGTFLATIKVFTELSENLGEAYEEMMKVTSAIGPLKKLTHFLNLETDLLLWKGVNRKRREQTAVARLEVMNEGNPKANIAEEERPVGVKTDRIELKVRGLTFSWSGVSGSQAVLCNVNMSTKQGNLVAVVGVHGSGKSTLLRLLGHSIFPDDGLIFIPTHLRILQISHDPILLNLTVWQNLIFGRHNADPQRVWSIMQQLDTPKANALLKLEFEKLGLTVDLDNAGEADAGAEEAIETASGSEGADSMEESGEAESMMWQDILSYTEKAKIHLARALIVNPEVLVLHRPLSHYDRKTAEKVQQIIKYHVSNRGVQLPTQSAPRRRPRTCFFSPSRVDQAKGVDVIWLVDGEGGVQVKEYADIEGLDLD